MYGTSHTGLVLEEKVTREAFSTYVDELEGTPTFDTFEFVFKPSTGKGYEAADESIGNGKKWADTDGLIYVAGAYGVFVLSPPFKRKEVDTAKDMESFAKELAEYKAALAKHFPGKKIKFEPWHGGDHGGVQYQFPAMTFDKKTSLGEFYVILGGKYPMKPKWRIYQGYGGKVLDSHGY